MVSLEELAAKGSRNYARKIPAMKRGFPAARERAIAGFNAAPFGPNRKAAYSEAWATMPANYDVKVGPGLETKWQANWTAKMRE
ncbi:MAG: hypothetical protein HWN51_02725 [Desulfobacterales bacterium]|nr:hypothetical protein [Desulfobacterales bacterium]